MQSSNNTYYLLLLLLLLFVCNVPAPGAATLYCKMQFLQSYSDGIYFRSLVGSLYELVVGHYAIQYVFTIYIGLVLALYLAVFYVLNRIVKKSGMDSPEFILSLLIVLSPLGLQRYLSGLMLFRLDPVMIILFFISVWLIIRNKYHLFFTALISLAGILVHEVYLLIFQPVIYLLSFHQIFTSGRKKLIPLLTILQAAFFALFYFIKIPVTGTQQFLSNYTARVAQPGEYEFYMRPDVFESLRKIYEGDIFNNIRYSSKYLISADGLISFIFCLFCLLPVAYIIRKSVVSTGRTLQLLTAAPFVLALLLVFIGIDSVRWFSMCSFAYLGICSYLYSKDLVEIRVSKKAMMYILLLFFVTGPLQVYYAKQNLFDITLYIKKYF